MTAQFLGILLLIVATVWAFYIYYEMYTKRIKGFELILSILGALGTYYIGIITLIHL
jgi:uncharacterized membrane protein YuzA (DUF378 family)